MGEWTQLVLFECDQLLYRASKTFIEKAHLSLWSRAVVSSELLQLAAATLRVPTVHAHLTTITLPARSSSTNRMNHVPPGFSPTACPASSLSSELRLHRYRPWSSSNSSAASAVHLPARDGRLWWRDGSHWRRAVAPIASPRSDCTPK